VSSHAKRVDRAVLDTNVLLRVLLSPAGISARLYELARAGDFRIVLSPAIVRELRLAFLKPHVRRRYPFPLAKIARFLRDLQAVSDMVEGHLELKYGSPDPNDNPILACAVEGRADAVVSDDRKHLLSLGQYRGIPILSVPDFLRRHSPGP